MAEQQTPPFRADHVGSLLRPPQLLAAREQAKAGRLPAAALREVEDEAIRRVATMQEELGLQGITDGEFRRQAWHMDFLYQFGGVTKQQDPLTIRFHNERRRRRVSAVVAPRHRQAQAGEDHLRRGVQVPPIGGEERACRN